MDKDTYTDTSVIQQSERFVPIKLNAEKEGKTQTEKFKVEGYPTTLFITPDEKVVRKIVGYLPPKLFEAEMKKAHDAFVNRPIWEEALKKNPKDLDALVGMVSIVVQEGDTERAEQMLKQAEAIDPKNEKGKLDDAYNAIGDAYQSAREEEKAIPYFEKAASGRDPDKQAYALISIAACKFALEKPKEAKPYLERLLKLGKAADPYRDQAEEMLKQAK